MEKERKEMQKQMRGSRFLMQHGAAAAAGGQAGERAGSQRAAPDVGRGAVRRAKRERACRA